MNRLALLLSLCCASAGAAELHFNSGGTQAILFDTPCSSKIVLALLKPEAHKFYQNGTVTVNNVTTPLCWRVSPDQQQVWVVDEDGELAMVPIELFAPKESI